MSRRWVSRVLATVLPWPSKAERQDSLRAARQGAARAHRKAAEADLIREDILQRSQELLERNHIAATIVASFGRGSDSGAS